MNSLFVVLILSLSLGAFVSAHNGESFVPGFIMLADANTANTFLEAHFNETKIGHFQENALFWLSSKRNILQPGCAPARNGPSRCLALHNAGLVITSCDTNSLTPGSQFEFDNDKDSIMHPLGKPDICFGTHGDDMIKEAPCNTFSMDELLSFVKWTY